MTFSSAPNQLQSTNKIMLKAASSSSGVLLFTQTLQQVNDSHHWAGGSRRQRTLATAARHPRSSRRRPAVGGSWRRKTAANATRHLQSSRQWASCLGKIDEVVSHCLPRGFYFQVSFSWIVGCSSIHAGLLSETAKLPPSYHSGPESLLCLRTIAFEGASHRWCNCSVPGSMCIKI